MEFLKKLFGRKKKAQKAQPAPEKPKEKEPRDVSLEEVEKDLDDVKEVEAQATEEKPVYHIKKHSDGWQIIKENATKAYRVFNYQKEAIEFADKENLEYLVYKADGTLREK